jgi:hypothetical protein
MMEYHPPRQLFNIITINSLLTAGKNLGAGQ